ncbi:xanthine dehydrogenase family protein molybdopterin-binding subunit [Parahaliea aestuarii]|uniref:Xanthine dehydrogenase family protein molybdopterin-binding subunit n=1 Tax=Parahaliea aestuarii TaxID=1852021 RepID=A0A5C8ZT06_9GAMM|nr:molybdopterin cofactor-binding domain-containing protein [Parahaliea aestuarii]TXS91555.1 xanthine dehydrogenase family protein molybdopterin-binding subunit [Parahaliea aestuarii]
MNPVVRLSRRRFLALTGVSASGLLLGGLVSGESYAATHGSEASGQRLNLFVSLLEDGTVEIIAHRSEMGTGIRTSLPQVVADEMEADWARVKVVQALGDAAYGSQNTDGSRSIRNFYTTMRQMGAAAKQMLEAAAAERWGVPLEQCRAEQHRVLHSDGRALGFGELAAAAAQQEVPDPAALTLKSREQFRYIGRDVPMVDLHDITTGKAVYGADVTLPDMVYASIERTPHLGGRIASYDGTAARKVRGVLDVVELKAPEGAPGFNNVEGLAVIARNTWSALKGRKALQVKWTPSEHSEHNSEAYLDALQEKVRSGPGQVARERGDVDAALATAGKVIEAGYRTPYLAHAPMEPPVTIAVVRGEGCELWAPTQNPQATQAAVAAALGLDKAMVKVHVTLLGGGFGRKSKPDFSVEAARLAAHVGKPVQVAWTRGDDIRHDYYHSCSAMFLRAALDEEGNTTAWLARQATPPIGSTFDTSVNLMEDGDLSQTFGSVPFAVPNLRVESHEAPAHTRIGWLRSVYNIPFAFGVCSFVDELAHAAGRDPAEYWEAMIGEDRHLDFAPEGFEFSNYGRPIAEYPYDTARLKNVLRTLVANIPWGEKLPAGQGWGLAVTRSFLSYVAVASKVSVADGKLQVLEMHGVIDAGTVVNPDRVQAQMEGGMIFGLSVALLGQIDFEGGAVKQSNYHDYPVARIQHTPKTIRSHIVPSEALPAGVGEPGVPPVAPSIANAVFAATGKRIRELPLSQHFSV